jgi:protein SCO1/2
MHSQARRIAYFFIILALITACFVMIKPSLLHRGIDKTQFHGTLLDKPRTILPFSLISTQDTPFDLKSLQGQWTMMFFGFTHCGSICPTTMATLGKMYRLLETQHVSPLPHVVMISIDPKHDSLKTLKQYVKGFHPSFEGARGHTAATEQLTKELGIAYAVIERDTTASHHYDNIEHSGAIMLFNPQGNLVAFFTSPHHADTLAHDYHLLVD